MCDMFVRILNNGNCPNRSQEHVVTIKPCYQNRGIHCDHWWGKNDACCLCGWRGPSLYEDTLGDGPDIQPAP